MYKVTFLIFLFVVFIASSEARPKRVNQIPNGSVNSCANCHVDPNGGGPRNAFGQLVETKYLTSPGSAGDVIWGPELAHEDADGDGFTNGEELQDSAGIWTGGSIGDPSLVFLPGDPNSHPPVTNVRDEAAIPVTLKLYQNYPNPFNPSTVIEYSIPRVSKNNVLTYVSLKVFDVLGNEISTLVEGYKSAGNYKVIFEAKDLSAGFYFYTLSTGNTKLTKKMVLMK